MFLVSDWKEKHRVKNCYNLTSSSYNKRYIEEQKNKYKHALFHLELSPNNKILDVGCGSGLLFSFLSSKVKTIVGIDISNELLQKAKKEKNNKKIQLIQADADHLPFQNNKFDIIFAFTVLQNMPAPMNTIKEMKLVAKKGGYIVLTGLKRFFSLNTIMSVLKRSGLETIATETGSELEDYLTINKKLE